MKIRKGTQTSLLNLKRAGRKPIHDAGIRHTARPFLKRPASLHLTIKVRKNKAEIKNKSVLKLLKHAIQNARRQGLRVVHYSLEYDHVHLLIEAENNTILGKGMQSFGVTMAKGINRLKKLKGSVYKHRYHFRMISSVRQLKYVMNYIFTNGMKHKRSNSIQDPFNSIQAEMQNSLFTQEKVVIDETLISILDRGKIFFHGLRYT